ncbi:YceI family protein [Kineobactrum salinum]|uniref:Polyisoprenoid-binding protein n=1 Tax=Kineobactrum salinum TaxID=2708301 RepID=A0A6C0TYR9_9GAMM|nr:YceI family protein [Kineobactrum salinum]QIB64529.1 polyisoprenoid-binding protein [Kineobactrum salinum]
MKKLDIEKIKNAWGHSMRTYCLIAVTMLCITLPVQAQGETDLPPGTYTLDKSHASLVFHVSHLGFTNYTMTFDSFDATLALDPAQLEKASLRATINPASLDLPSPPEGFTDTILNDENWLNAKVFPEIIFISRQVEMTGEKTANVHGDLELLGVRKPVILETVFNGGYKGHPMDPNARIGFSATGTFKRSDFGMAYGLPEPGTTMGVGDEIHVVIEAEFTGPPLQEPDLSR